MVDVTNPLMAAANPLTASPATATQASLTANALSPSSNPNLLPGPQASTTDWTNYYSQPNQLGVKPSYVPPAGPQVWQSPESVEQLFQRHPEKTENYYDKHPEKWENF